MSQQSISQPKPVPVKTVSKSQKFLSAWGLLVAKADRALEKQGQDLSEKYDKAKDTLTGTMKQPDAERRLQRLDGLIAQYGSDERFKDAVSAVRSKAVNFRTRIKNKQVTDWTELYNQIGIETAMLLERIEMAKKAEIAGRALAPKALNDAVKFVEDALASEKLTETERGGFQTRLITIKRELITAGETDKKKRKDGMLDQTAVDAQALQLSVEHAIAQHKLETDRLTLRKDGLMQRLSSAGNDPAGMQLRIEISGELRLAEGDIALGDYPAAALKLDGVKNKLDQLAKTDQAMQTALTPAEIEELVEKQIKRWDDATTTAEKAAPGLQQKIQAPTPQGTSPTKKIIPPPAAKLAAEARIRAGRAIFLLQDVLFMVKNAPGSAVVAAKKLFECTDIMSVAIDLLVRATAIVRDPNSKDNGNTTGDGSTETEKQLAALKQQVDAKFIEVTTDCENAYKLVDPTGKSGGEAMTAIAESKQRWEQTKSKAMLADQLEVPAYLAEIERLARQVAQVKDAVANNAFGPEDLSFETRVVKYREDMPQLQELARSIGEENSDRAVALGLVARPPALANQAETLIRAQASKRGTAANVTERINTMDKILKEISDLMIEAKKPATTRRGEMTADELRRNCKLHMDNYTKTIDAVILALTDDVRILTGSRDERTARVAYGGALKTDMATIAAPLASKDLALLQDVFAKLVAFETRVAAFENMAPGKKSDPGVPDFNKVLERAKKLQTKLTADPLAKRQAAMTKEADELKRIIANASTLDPGATDKLLTGLEQTINTAVTGANGEHEKAKALAAKCDKLWPQLQTPKDKERKKKYASYYEDLIRRILALRDELVEKDSIGTAPPTKSGSSPGLTKSQTEYDGLEKEVAAALATQESVWKDACTKGQAKSQADDKKVEQMKYRLENLREVDLKLLKEKASDQTGDAKAELKKQIDDTDKSIGLALQELAKTRNVEAAKEMADSLASRLKRMADAPYGKSTRARNNLGEVETRWKTAVGKFGTALDTAGQSVKSACAGNPEAEKAAAALALKLNEVKTLFQADAFSAVIKRMSGPKPPASQVAAAREDGLREVRRLNRAMNAHPTLRQLAQIPFQNAVLPIGEIGSALWDLETNLTISG
jgi:plasmid stabilization system protein ParE